MSNIILFVAISINSNHIGKSWHFIWCIIKEFYGSFLANDFILIFKKFMLTLMRFNFNLVSLVCFNLWNRELLLDSLKLKFILTNSDFKTIHFTTFLVTFIVEHINYWLQLKFKIFKQIDLVFVPHAAGPGGMCWRERILLFHCVKEVINWALMAA